MGSGAVYGAACVNSLHSGLGVSSWALFTVVEGIGVLVVKEF